MAYERDLLFARASAAIEQSKRLTLKRRFILEETIAIYERRMISAMKAVSGVQLSEEQLVERYRQLTSADRTLPELRIKYGVPELPTERTGERE